MYDKSFEEIINSNNIICKFIDEPRTSKLARKLIIKELTKKNKG